MTKKDMLNPILQEVNPIIEEYIENKIDNLETPTGFKKYNEKWNVNDHIILDGNPIKLHNFLPNKKLHNCVQSNNESVVMFVSDLHVSDFGLGDDFLLFHDQRMKNGKNPKLSKSFILKQALIVAQRLSESLPNDPGVELILLGDAFDILETMGRNSAIFHPPLKKVLKEFRGWNSKNKIIHILGNHDFITPKPYVSLVDKIGYSYLNKKLEIFGIHGHQFDKNSFNPEWGSLGSTIITHLSELEVLHLNTIRMKFSKNIKTPYEFPFLMLDNFKPLSRLQEYIPRIFPNSSDEDLKSIYQAISYTATLGKNDNSTLVPASDLLKNKQTTGYDGKKITIPENIRYVVMGHTHFSIISPAYYNMGTWMSTQIIEHDSATNHIIDTHPFLLHFRDKNRKINSHYFMMDKKGYHKRTDSFANRFRKMTYGNVVQTINQNGDIVQA